MVPLRLATRNRWWTLLWGAGVCLTAMEIVGHREEKTVAVAVKTPTATADLRAGDADDLGAAVTALRSSK